MSNIEFIKDPGMDTAIEDLIDTFKLDEVELVRLSGLTMRFRRISGRNDVPAHVVESIVRKLKTAGLLEFKYILKCPHCNEISFITKYDGVSTIGPKLCDSCNTLYQPLLGSTLERDC